MHKRAGCISLLIGVKKNHVYFYAKPYRCLSAVHVRGAN